MKRLCMAWMAACLIAGCGGSSPDLPPTVDADAIKKEQEKLRGPLPGGTGTAKSNQDDAIKREQERLRRGP